MASQKNKELKNFVDNVAEKSHLRVEKDLGDGYFKLRASEAQRRQAKQDIRCVEDIIIEVLRNSRDAHAKNIFLATNIEENNRNIYIIDDGVGVPKSHHKLIFEPYVTSKLDTVTNDIWGIHGRGMALYSIASNVKESLVVNSNNNIGCSIYIKCDLNKLPEKRDQSSFPDFYINEDSELVVRGPKNIQRTACEFAIENRDKVNIYLGSPVDIASTLYYLYQPKTDIKSIFDNPNNDTRIVEYLRYSSDVHDFKNFASKIGIPLSKRTARRIMDGNIKPQISLLEKITNKGIENLKISSKNKNKSLSGDIYSIKGIHKSKKNSKPIKISADDKKKIADDVANNFVSIANKYYLNTDVMPSVSIKNNKLTVSIDLIEL